ncbi:MAG: hypothetical protein R2727_11585 [Bacteroidales bacterium]
MIHYFEACNYRIKKEYKDMYLKLLLLSLGLMLLAVAALGIRMPYSRARFPQTHIGRNRRWQKEFTCTPEY